ncbi:UDP-galactose transmembrane transporter [Aureococcus anophagefferens]|nr:UDP-galactose transmembrane transporter [Aureococcus anophagefferens]
MSGGGDASEQLTPADGRKYWVLAKSCKPIPVMIMGAFLGKRYPLKYVNVLVITAGVCLFMLGGSATKPAATTKGMTMIIGCVMLFVSLSFDGATGAYEDKIMSNDHVGPFELMFNIQLEGDPRVLGLVMLNEIDYFFTMVQETGPILLVLGLTGAMGQVFIFVTIAQFGALMCSLIGLGRKITTLIASIIIYQHPCRTSRGSGLKTLLKDGDAADDDDDDEFADAPAPAEAARWRSRIRYGPGLHDVL